MFRTYISMFVAFFKIELRRCFHLNELRIYIYTYIYIYMNRHLTPPPLPLRAVVVSCHAPLVPEGTTVLPLDLLTHTNSAPHTHPIHRPGLAVAMPHFSKAWFDCLSVHLRFHSLCRSLSLSLSPFNYQLKFETSTLRTHVYL